MAAMISLFAGEERSTNRDRLGDPLQVLDKHIDFAALAKVKRLGLVCPETSGYVWFHFKGGRQSLCAARHINAGADAKWARVYGACE